MPAPRSASPPCLPTPPSRSKRSSRSAEPMRAPEWLTARPVAHRGLHDAARGVIENMPSAFRAAIDRGFAVELDVQLTADGEAIVHHDAALGRLNEGSEKLSTLTVAQLKQVAFRQTA